MGLFKKQTQSQTVRQPASSTGQNDYAFRRSRTLTGSASSSVTSAAEGNTHLSSPRLRLHQLHRHRRGVLFGLVGSACAIVLLGWTVGQYVRLPDDFSYKQPLNAQPTTNEYTQAIATYFNAHPTERFLFNLQHDRLNQQIIQQHPEVQSVKLAQLSPGQFDVTVSFREPLVSWKSGDRQMYVDADGIAFHENLFTEPAVVVDDQSGITLDGSNAVASGRFITFLGQLVSHVNEGGVGRVAKVIIPAGTTRQVDIQLEQRQYLIKTHIDRAPMAQAHDVIKAVQYIEGRGGTPEYIDVRVAGKAFYR